MDPRTLLFDADGGLQPPWRVAIFLVATLAALVAVNAVVVPLVAAGAWFVARQRLGFAAWGTLAALLLAHLAAFRAAGGNWQTVRLGRRAFRPRALLIGFAVGALAIGLPTLGLLGLGWLRVQPAPAGSSLLAAGRLLLVLAPAALWEELLARGYAFMALRAWGDGVAVVLTSATFGLLHLHNAGVTLQAVGQVVFAGVWLCGVLLATGSLYAAWTAHLGWNWTMAALLHTPVSGWSAAVPDFTLADAGPDWATGGAWGPEAGLGAMLGMAATLVFLFMRRRRREEPTEWQTV